MTKARDIADLGDSIINDANNNVALGDGALDDASLSGSNNVAIGEDALAANTSASNNTAVGYQAGYANTTGTLTAIGRTALQNNTTGVDNTATGRATMSQNTTGGYNTAVGALALLLNTTASNNTAVGYQAGYANQTGTLSTFVGFSSGIAATGDRVTSIGSNALQSLTSGTHNTAIGQGSGSAITTGSKNTILGMYTGNQGGLDIRTSSNNIVLSDGDGNPRGYYGGSTPCWVFVTPTTGQNHTQFHVTASSGNIYGPAIQFKNQAPNDTNVYALNFNDSSTTRFRVWSNGNVVNQNNSYGSLSDEKLKENIIDSGSQWDDIKALRVRKYSMKSDNLDAPNMLGVIAQEVEAAGMGGLVFESPDKDDDLNDLGTVTKQVNYSILYMKAVKALQEAMDRIETLEAKVAALEAN